MKARTLSDRIEREFMTKFHQIVIPIKGDIQLHSIMNDCRDYFRRIGEKSIVGGSYLAEGGFYITKYIILSGLGYIAARGISELVKYCS